MQFLKQSTAATVTVGPILDSAGAEYTSAVIGDLSIRKQDGSVSAMASAATLTHSANGVYTLVMTTGNTDTLGRLDIHCNKSTYQMPPKCYDVLPAMRYDSLVLGSDRFDVNVTHVADTSQTARDIGLSVLLSSGTGTGQVKLSSGYVAPNWGDVGNPTTSVNLSGTTTNVVNTATAVTTVNGLANNVLTAAATAADFSTELRTAINGGDYALSTDSNGRVRIVDGTGTGELDTLSGTVLLRSANEQVLADWVNGGRLDLILDIIAADVVNLDGAAMRGTDNASLATALATAQTDLDTITGTDGVTLATTQGNYAPSKAGDAMALIDGALTNAKLAGNMEIVFETDFAANYNTTVDAWNVSLLYWKGDSMASAVSGSAPSHVYTMANDVITAAKVAPGAIDAATFAADVDAEVRSWLGMAVASYDTDIAGLPTQAEITGGNYALDTDANGRIRIVDGTGTGELDTASGLVKISGTLQTLDDLDTAQDSQHSTTQALVAASAIRAAIGLALANLDTQLGDLPTAAENTAAVFAQAIESGVSFLQAQRGMVAKAFGEISNAGTGTEVIHAAGNPATTRLTATVDSSGNITNWTLNL